MAQGSYLIPNLIQGVSQQSAEQRRASQCEAQQNCINSPKEGCVARPSLDFRNLISTTTWDAAGIDWLTSAFYEIFRGNGEHYLAIIPTATSTHGDVRVWDLANNTECTVTKDGSETTYLALPSINRARDYFTFKTVDDYTFVANKTVATAMTGATRAARPPEALIFIKGGNYLQHYSVAILYNGHRYIYDYKTPDNSAAGNAAYIATTAIASALYKAMAGSDAHQITDGEVDSGVWLGTQGIGGTPGSGTITSGTAVGTLGFSIEIRGNVIRLWRAGDTNAFKVDTGDGTGNTFMGFVKDSIQSLDKLPLKAMEGFRVKVVGSTTDKTSPGHDYFVEFTAQEVWQECAGAGINTTLDAATMPHALINTGPGAFTWTAVTWSTRLVGDDDSAPKPYFVGKKIQDMFFLSGRLGFLTEGAYDLSKTRNSFNFFPDTVQLTLATAPIDNPLSGHRSISLMRRAVQLDETMFFWAQQAQFRLSTGVEALRPDTAEAKVITAYEWAEGVQPYGIGSDLYYVVEPDQWSQVKAITFSQQGRPSPEINVTDHIPSYIAAPVRALFADQTRKIFFVQSDSLPNGFYVYQYLASGQELVQSAWQTWLTVPGMVKILWASVFNGKLFVAMQWDPSTSKQLVIATMDLIGTVDPGGAYHTRLDMRITESACVSRVYDAPTNTTTLVLPYKITADAGAVPHVFIRTTTGDHAFYRGREIPVIGHTTTGIIVPGNHTTTSLYVGYGIESFLELSEFFPRDLNGASQLFEQVTTKRLLVTHAKTGYYKVVLTMANGTTKEYPWSSRKAGVAGGLSGELVPDKGLVDVPVAQRNNQYSAKLLNNTIFPSAWQRVRVIYSYEDRGVRDLAQ